MANEVRGSLSEATLVLALEYLGYTIGIDLHWGKTPAALTVCESDVTIGDDVDNPTAIFQSCSSGYEGGYQKKFWRDMGELIEIRQRLPLTRVVSVIFEPGVREKLTTVYKRVAEDVIQVDKLALGSKLLLQLESLGMIADDLPPEERLALLKKKISTATIAQLASALKPALVATVSHWDIPHVPGKVVEPSKMNLRRAVLTACLFTAPSPLVNIRDTLRAISKGVIIPPAPFLTSLASLGVCGGIANRRCMDENLQAVLRHLGVDPFIKTGDAAIASNPDSRLRDYVRIIHSLPSCVPLWLASLKAHQSDIYSETKLAKAIVGNFSDYSLWLDKGAPQQFEPWIFRRLFDLVRACDGKHFAIGIPRFDPEFAARGLQALRFTAPEYVAGRRALTKPEARAIADIICPRLRSLAAQISALSIEEFSNKVSRSEYEQRLMTYRGFSIFDSFIQGVFGDKIQTFTPPVASAAGVVGAATSQVVGLDDAMITWQGATKLGVGHKVKEQVGRMGLCCLVEKNHAGKRSFKWNSKIQQRILYIDGAWSATDLAAVAETCFTEIRTIM